MMPAKAGLVKSRKVALRGWLPWNRLFFCAFSGKALRTGSRSVVSGT